MYCIDAVSECNGCMECEERFPACPVCGEETETVFVDELGEVHGCPNCLEERINGDI